MTSARGKQTTLSCPCYWEGGRKGRGAGLLDDGMHITLLVLKIYCGVKKDTINSLCAVIAHELD